MKTIISKIKNRRKHKVVFILESTGKKICTVRFNDKEFFKIKLVVQNQGITLEEFFLSIIRNTAKK